MFKLVTPPVVPVSLPASARLVIAQRDAADFRANRAEKRDSPAADIPTERASDADLQVAELGPAEAATVSDALDSGLAADERGPRFATKANGRLSTARALLEDSRWEHVVLFLMMAGTLFWWGLAAVRIVRFERVLRSVRPIESQWQVQADELARRLGLSLYPTVCLVPGRVPPLLWAFLSRPRLLVPLELWSMMSQDERTSLLVHELAHLKRRDHWVRWLELIVAGLYWWHPVVWWVRRRLREAEEQCCDAWVLWAMPEASKTYAAALLAALEFVSGARAAPATASAIGAHGPISCLKRRMRMIMRANTPKGLSWAGRLAVLGTAALLLPLAPSWAEKTEPSMPPSVLDRLTDSNIAPSDLGLAREPDRQEAQAREALGLALLAQQQSADAKLDARASEEFLKNPDVAALDKQIAEIEGQVALIRAKVRSTNDPALHAAERQLKKLNEEYVGLLNEKYPAIVARLRQDDDKDDDKDDDEDDDKDDDEDDDKSREAAERFEKHVRDLIAKLVDEAGPVADEIRKAVERSVDEVRKALDKEDLSSDDVRDALERSHDEMRRSFESGGPIDREAREAWERARGELGEAWDRVREDFREVIRDRRDSSRERQRELLDRARAARERARAEAQADRERQRARSEAERRDVRKDNGPADRDEMASARREVQELRQQLERATRRLDELQRREIELRRSRRPRREPTPPAEPAPERSVPPRETTPAPRSPGEPAVPATPARPGQPGVRRVRPPVGPGGPGGRRFAPGSESDRRLRELEDKMDRLLKELEGLKGEKKNEPEKPSARSERPGYFDSLLGGIF
jgi:beta-lactamase regulating signal transducer with metallopeptidase domain